MRGGLAFSLTGDVKLPGKPFGIHLSGKLRHGSPMIQ